MPPCETLALGRWAHPRGGRLHWRQAGQDAALCGCRVPLDSAWQAPTFPLDLLRCCHECEEAVSANLRDALTISAVLPGMPATAGRR